MPRILFAAARDKVLKPQALANVHTEFKTPYISIIVYAALGLIFSSIGELKLFAASYEESSIP